ncbi:hypothetical protein K437DRAFT_295626 [Tilletiaria anomala UBC 951]|uniref:RRM domain-containing protein n=1 Tax=Tilletiaria anomala (strain ATCC 24038 / CBS 436.72 / UBC 951) TaxID=1037660 RepID=A0A066VRC2_TILAU|nr:uncharacterized protein K437DRAFT_295626 [Tilletiaria anomala UBC 951]KDN41319.1 hypothetical protein K437DRAFT_295626 [Tilletiaria anomala UBC 951]
MAPKKNKMSLTDFLGDSGGKTSWADDMDDLPTAPAPRESSYARGGGDYLSSMPDRKDRDAAFAAGSGAYGGPPRDDVPLPTRPPFTAFIGNLNFDVTEGDVLDFFAPLTVTSTRLVSGPDGRPKGFGYVEFDSVDTLKGALERHGGSFGGRTVRISVAEPPRTDRPGFAPSIADEASQWRRAGPLAADGPGGIGLRRRESNFGGTGSRFGAGGDGPSGFDSMEVGEGGRRVGFGSGFQSGGPTPERAAGGFGRSRYAADAAGPGGYGGPGPISSEPGPGDEASNWRTGKPVESTAFGSGGPGTPRSDRPPAGSRRESLATDMDEKYAGLERMGFGAKFSPAAAPTSPTEKRGGFGFGERKNSAFGAGAAGLGSSGDRTPAAPGPADEADTWRSSRKGSVAASASRKPSTSDAAAAGGDDGSGPAAPTQRKRLELKPRSEGADAAGAGAATSPTSAGTSSKGGVNPFGNAKPVDAAERERQIEERMRQRDAERKEERERKRERELERKEKEKKTVGDASTKAGADAPSTPTTDGSVSAEDGSAAAAAKRPSQGQLNPPTNPWKKVEPKARQQPSETSASSSPTASASGAKIPRGGAPAGAQCRTSASASSQSPAPANASGEAASTCGSEKRFEAASPAAPQQRECAAPATGAWGGGRKAAGALAVAAGGAPKEKDGADAGAEVAKAVMSVEIKE